MKKWIFIVIAGLVVGAVIVSILTGGDKAEAKVETGRVVLKNLTAQVNCSGTIQPKRKVDVSANTMGKVVELAVREGDRVERGQLLLRIDPVRYRGEVDQSRASLRAARADVPHGQAPLRSRWQPRRLRQRVLWYDGLYSADPNRARSWIVLPPRVEGQRA